MGQRLDQLCTTLGEMLYRIEHRVHAVRTKIEGDRMATDAAVARQLEEAMEALARIRDDAEAAQLRMVEAPVTGEETVARWKRDRDHSQLERRAEHAEAYAAWSVIVAAKAIDEADLAAVQALAARLDVETAAGGRTNRRSGSRANARAGQSGP